MIFTFTISVDRSFITCFINFDWLSYLVHNYQSPSVPQHTHLTVNTSVFGQHWPLGPCLGRLAPCPVGEGVGWLATLGCTGLGLMSSSILVLRVELALE